MGRWSPLSRAAAPQPASHIASLRNNTNPTSWLLDAGMRRLNFWMGMCLISSYGAGYDGSLFTGLLTLGGWFVAMGVPDSNMIGIIGMSGVLGLIGGPFLGQWLCDRIGRPRTMIISALVAVVGGILNSLLLSNSKAQRDLFICARVLVSFGGGMTTVASPILMSELAHPRQRPVVVSLFQCGFYTGSVLAAWITFGTNAWQSTWAWRLPCLLQITPFALQLLVLPFCPESPRWLVAKGRSDEALATLAKYHANGDEDDELVKYELAEIVAAIESEARQEIGRWSELVATKANRLRMFIIVTLGMGTQFVGNAAISYYLAPILATVGIESSRQQAVFNGGLAIFNLGIASSAAFLAERLGRRLLFITSAAGMLAAYIGITVCSALYADHGVKPAGKGVIALLFLYFFFYDIALTPLAVSYPAEILPFRLRSKGMAVSVSVVAVSLVFNIWVVPIALEHIRWKLYIAYVACLALFLVCIVLVYPETKGRTIEEIEEIFDGPRDIVPESAQTANVAQLCRGAYGSESQDDEEKSFAGGKHPTVMYIRDA